jgi:endo-1,4-beta-xylanase
MKNYLFILVLFIVACKKQPIVNPDPKPSEEFLVIDNSTTLKSKTAFPVGMQCYIGILDFQVPSTRVSEQFTSFTAASLFWKGIEPTLGNYNFTDMDKCVDYCTRNKLRIHAHALVYFQNDITPDYIKNFAGTKAEFEALVKTHIQTVVNRYKGKVAAFDVVNEMISDFKGTLYFNNYIERFYQNDAGYEEFIGKCFTYAREADPSSKLFYNESLLELTNQKKLNATLSLLTRLKANKIPIDGIGTQMHVDIYYPMSSIDNALKKLAETGLLVHISELDVSVNEDANGKGNLGITDFTPNLADQQGKRYRAIARSYQQNVPAAQQWGITCWDLMDHTSWLNQFRKEWPCLFDQNCDKKPAFYGFLQGIGK